MMCCSCRRYPKPPYAYTGLITAAIWASPEGALTVSDIYASLRRMFPFFSSDYTGWQSSVRHTLTNTACFINKTTNSHRRWTVDAARVPPEAFRRQSTPEARRGQYAVHLLTHLAAADATPPSGQVDVTSRAIAAPPIGKLSFGVESFLPSRAGGVCLGAGACVGSYAMSHAGVCPPSLAVSKPFTVESFLPSISVSHTDVKPTFPVCATAAPPDISTHLPPRGFESRLPVVPLADTKRGYPSLRPSFTTPRSTPVEVSRTSHTVSRPFDIDSLLSFTPRRQPSYFQPVAPPSAEMKCLSSGLYTYNASSIPQSIERCNSLSF